MGNFEIAVTVLMSVYNTKEEYLRQSIESILQQSFTDYEFIIFNDCSNEKTSKILREYKDKRIRLIENSENRGLTKNLNTGIDLARGKYLARMDADDISLPNRLKIQHSYMEKHPDVDILGGYILSENRKHLCWRFFPQELRRVNLLFGNCGIYHPSAFFRMDFLNDNEMRYNEEFDKSQDYELWTRAFRIGKLAVCNKLILYYRRHEGQISVNSVTSRRQKELEEQVRKNLFIELLNSIAAQECMQLLNLNKEVISADQLSDLFIRMIEQNAKKEIYSAYYLKNELALRWFWILRGIIPRDNLKEYKQGYWFSYLQKPQFIAYLLKNRFLRIICETRKAHRYVGDGLR